MDRSQDTSPAGAALARSAGITLEVVSGPEDGRRISVAALPCRLGRGKGCEVALADPDNPPALSREHATLEGSVEVLIVRDHSVNGTRVGNRWLQRGEAAAWLCGDALQLGPSLWLRRLAEAPGQQALHPPVSHPQEQASGASREAITPAAMPGALRAFLTSPETLAAAWRRVELNRGAAGPDNVTVPEFGLDAPRRLGDLRRQLMRGRYEPLPPRLFAAPKRSGGVRRIAILSVTDRIVQQALHMALQPLLEPHFPPCSYAYRPGMGAHHALRHIDRLLRQGFPWVAETDIATFFDTVAHRVLLDKLAGLVPDPFTLSLVSRCLAVGAAAPGAGLAQGAAASPLLSNLYLAEFDAHMLAGGWNPVRYGDDLVFVGMTRGKAQAALAEAEGFLRSRLHLSLQPEKTGTASLARGFTFLGYRFTEQGRRPSSQAVAHLRERLEETAPTQAPAVQRGWENYFGQASSAVQARLDEESLSRFLRLFGGREDAHALQEKGRFTPCAGPLTPEQVHAHLAGTQTLAAYLQRKDGTVRAVVLDMDVARRQGGVDDALLAPVAAFARDLARACRTFGVPTSLEDSGRRGRHLWIFFSAPVAPERARRLARLLSLQAGFPRPGVRLEILPRHTEWPGPDLGDAVKLPFGVHPETGRRCHLLDVEGEPIADPVAALAQVQALPAVQVEAVIALLTRVASPENREDVERTAESDAGTVHEMTEYNEMTDNNVGSSNVGSNNGDTDPVAQLLNGCGVLRALAERARQTGHLRHTHNLILLYTVGRLGAPGAAFVHRTLAQCRNYDARVCQGYLDRLDVQHPPLSCSRIREWLEEEGGEAGLCACAPGRRTPLDCLKVSPAPVPPKARAPKSRPAAPALPSSGDAGMQEAWHGVQADLFTDADLFTEEGAEEVVAFDPRRLSLLDWVMPDEDDTD